ncbi:hypothetical protein FRC08_011359 [Ceratobasidium sp. 394]|nr:hypothetical protein FRC08_011359 [Ceratobasidium sp. 394]KAG9099954.1 hypothetical protein FS749_016652 [Ceratobasidium sp. UAMH 11750]
MTEAGILHATIKGRCRTNAVAETSNSSSSTSSISSGAKKAMELWKERAIATENILKQYKSA